MKPSGKSSPWSGTKRRRKSVIIRTQFAEDLSPVPGDRVQLQQVVLNLVMNGIEAMSSVGERARELVITTRNIDADQVQVTVEDSGIGLDPKTMDKIFEPFYTTKPGGMGMGLSISRSILQSHGGRLWATAKDGPGTSFHLPFRSTTKKNQCGSRGSLTQSSRLWTTTPRCGRVSSSLIRSAGWRAETFASAQEFLARPRAEAPSCLVLDLQLPG